MWQLQNALGIVKENIAWERAMIYREWVVEVKNY